MLFLTCLSQLSRYVEYEMDAEERVREINMLKFHIDRLMIECVRIAQAIQAIDVKTIHLSGAVDTAAISVAADSANLSPSVFASLSPDGSYQFENRTEPEKPAQHENEIASELRHRLTHAAQLKQTLDTCVREGMKDFADSGDSKLQVGINWFFLLLSVFIVLSPRGRDYTPRVHFSHSRKECNSG